MEPQPRPAERAAFRNRRHYRLNGSASFETRVLTIGANRRSARKSLYDSLAIFSFADLKGRSRFHRRTLRWFPLEDGGGLAPRGACGSVNLNTVISSEARNLSSLVSPAACAACRGKIEIAARRFLAELRLDPVTAANARGERSAAV